MKVVILAGGRGTRMGALTMNRPKPLVEIAGQPILAHQLELAARYGVREAVLLTGHLGDLIHDHFGREWQGIRLTYLKEQRPLGTAGALLTARQELDQDFLVFYGDTIMDVDLARLFRAHRCASADTIATLVVHPNDHPHDSDLIEVDGDRIVRFLRKPHAPDLCVRNLVNAALYVMSPKILKELEPEVFADFGQDVFPRLVQNGSVLRAYQTAEYIKDVGTVSRHGDVERDILSGKVTALNWNRPHPCVFLDRDGTINEEIDCVRSPDQFRLIPGAGNAIYALNRAGYLVVIVTNQPGIAKGFFDERDLERIHARMETDLGRYHAYVDRTYVCPHHPESGHQGERRELKFDCDCRKPAAGMLIEAVRDLNLDLSRSFIIGDRTVDVLTGHNAGVVPLLVRTGYAGKDRKFDCAPAAAFENLPAAVDYILGRESQTRERI